MFIPRSVSKKRSAKRGKEEAESTSRTSKQSSESDVLSTDDVKDRTEVTFGQQRDDNDIVLLSKHQRWPVAGEPVCVVCGRYGEYIVDDTERDVCSMECKKQHLRQKDITIATTDKITETSSRGQNSVEEKGCDEGVAATRGGGVAHLMTEEQAEFLRQQLGIEILEGGNVPRPITEFSQLPLTSQLRDNLKRVGYTDMTPVQMQVIPAAMSGRDLMVSSTTGSGKTLSFLLPIIHLLSLSDVVAVSVPLALILSPTRELCCQLEEQAKELMRGIPNMLTALLVGGVPLAHQLHRLKSSIKIIIATPARLNDIIENHASSLVLSGMQNLVLDEVDSLLEMGFEDQIKSILSALPVRRQSLMFSATIPPKTEELARDILINPLYISVGTPGAPCSSIKHTILWVEEVAKKKTLFSMITDKEIFHPPTIIFVSSRKGALLLAEALNKMIDIAAVAIHGEMAQDKRSYIHSGIRQGKYEAVVATGLLGRGLHVENIKQVFNFDMPSSIQEFVHQVGRAGQLDSPGWAISFVNNENKGIFLDLIELLQDTGTVLPQQLVNSPHVTNQRMKRKRKRDYEDSGQPNLDYLKKNSLMRLISKSK